MNFKNMVPQCRVNLDYGGFFQPEYMKNQGILNIPYLEGSLNLAAMAIGMMADTITVFDDGMRPVEECVKIAKKIAPLAERVLIIRRENGGYCVETIGTATVGSSYAVCAHRNQRHRQVYVC